MRCALTLWETYTHMPLTLARAVASTLLKRIVMKLIPFFVLLLMFAGCATTANYEKILRSYVGASVDKLVMRWGPPHNSYPLSNGGKMLEYSDQRNVQIGGYATTVPQTTYSSGTANVYGTGGSARGTYSGTSTTYVQTTTPVQNIAFRCTTRFTVNAQGVVTNWSWQGNDCKAMEPK